MASETKQKPAAIVSVEPSGEIPDLRQRVVEIENRLRTPDRSGLEGLAAQLKLVACELELLKSEVRGNGLTVQRQRPLTRAEVEQVLESKPAQTFLVLAPFPDAGLKPGDRFDARQRFPKPSTLALHVDRGLQVTIPPQA